MSLIDRYTHIQDSNRMGNNALMWIAMLGIYKHIIYIIDYIIIYNMSVHVCVYEN